MSGLATRIKCHEAGTREKKKMAKSKAKSEKQDGKKTKKSAVSMPDNYSSRLLDKYRKEVVPAMQKKFEYKNPMQVPMLQKIVVNMGVGEATTNIKLLDSAIVQLGKISSQKPQMSRARRSVAQFKVREGMPVGCFVTLRGWKMYDFLDRLINVAIPRVRDFRGLPTNAFDGRGNYSLGIKEQIIFTELDYNEIERTQGMNITAVTTANTDAECHELLRLFGMPFRRN